MVEVVRCETGEGVPVLVKMDEDEISMARAARRADGPAPPATAGDRPSPSLDPA